MDTCYFTRPQKMPGREKVILGIMLLIVLLIRLYYIYTSPEPKLTHDEIGYHEMTLRFFEEGFLGYYAVAPTAFVTPGYPVFLIITYFIAGLIKTDPLITARTVQVIISIASLLLVYLIARKSAGPAAGILALVFASVYSPSLMANTRILTEVLYIFMILAYLYSLMLAFEREDLWRHAVSGGTLALAVLVRPSAAPFLVVPYIIVFIIKRDIRVLMALVVAAVAFSVVMTPWWVRNYLVLDKFIMFATQSGDPILRGTDPWDIYDRYGPSIIEGVPNAKKTEVALQRIKDGFSAEPWLWIKWFTIGKLSFLWLKPWGVFTAWTNFYHLWIYVVLGWLGVLVNLFDRRLRWAALFVIFMTVIHLAFIPIARYIYPLTPIMSIMAATLPAKIIQRYLTLPS